ncbi:unnamed protein product, partial [Urochloa humidicola]
SSPAAALPSLRCHRPSPPPASTTVAPRPCSVGGSLLLLVLRTMRQRERGPADRGDGTGRRDSGVGRRVHARQIQREATGLLRVATGARDAALLVMSDVHPLVRDFILKLKH